MVVMTTHPINLINPRYQHTLLTRHILLTHDTTQVNGGYEKILSEGGLGATDREGLLNDAKTLAERSHRAVVSMFDKQRGLMMPKGGDRQPFNGGRG